MRASMVTACQTGARSDTGNLTDWGSQPRNGNRASRSPAIYTYDDFEQLTSVHINSTDDYFLASGYSKHVGMYDLRTGKRLEIFTDLHEEHINVVKFAHHSPFLFATSSFDKEIKMWDIRIKAGKPLYTTRSNRGNVMVCFSRDDHYLLSSAVDNEVYIPSIFAFNTGYCSAFLDVESSVLSSLTRSALYGNLASRGCFCC